MRRVVSYSILIMLCMTTLGAGVVVATVFSSAGLPESDIGAVVTAVQTPGRQILPTTTPVESPTSELPTMETTSIPTMSPVQPTGSLVSPTVEMVSTPTNEPLPTISVPTPSQSASSDVDYIEYTVQSGDLLYIIALEYDVTVEDIITNNSIENPDSLTVGSIIRIPQP